MTNLLSGLLLILFSYFLGSIPFGLIFTRLAGTKDIRSIGSGNIGATNVLRTGNKLLAFLTFLFDALKGIAAVLLAAWLDPTVAPWAGLGAILGHIYPLWLNFKGGKGVATALGVLLGLSPSLGLMALVTWLVVAFVWRYSSLAALVAILLSPLYTLVLNGSEFVVTTLLMSLILIHTHKQNIRRLLAGSEPKIGESNTTPGPDQPA